MCLCCVYVRCVFEISFRCGICVVYVLFVCVVYMMCATVPLKIWFQNYWDIRNLGVFEGAQLKMCVGLSIGVGSERPSFLGQGGTSSLLLRFFLSPFLYEM